MATRLDRLLLLLETGSNPVTRKAAAQQLGEVQRLHPHELNSLLRRVHTLLKSSNWDTRVAAALAIEAIAKHVPNWEPTPVVKVKVEKEEIENPTTEDGRFKFESFDILTVVKHGEPLLGSAGDEFDIDDDSSSSQGCTHEELLARQRQMLRKRLGLDMIGGVDLGMDGLVDDGDLIVTQSRKPKLGTIGKQSSTEKSNELMAIEIAAINSNKDMSAREKNSAIRKAKKLIKQRSKDQQDSAFTTSKSLDLPDQPAAKKLRRSASVVIDQPGDSNKVLVDHVGDSVTSLEDLEEWPFQNFYTELCNELFHLSWEVRHGAASGLREIIKIHGSGAGKRKTMNQDQMEEANTEWLEDTALRLLCVFALDRFGDYVSDEVIAPVRETCSQTLGSVLHYMTNESVGKVLKVLLTLQEQDLWQVRHGGHLGIKYVLALKKDLTNEILPTVLPSIKKGLQDDDVRAVAAASLVPVSSELVSLMPNEIPVIVNILWDILLDLDDLDSSTKSVMSLLSSLISKKSMNDSDMQSIGNMTELFPRLWPFLKHNISAVRRSALESLKTLLSQVPDISSAEGNSWLEPILADQLRHIYQRLILESNGDICEMVMEVWSSTVHKASIDSLTRCTKSLITTWFSFLVTPHTSPFDTNRLIGYGNYTKSSSKNNENGIESTNYYLGGITPDMDSSSKENIAVKSRLLGARAIAMLLARLNDGTGQTNDTVLLIFQTILQMLSVTSALQKIVAAMVLTEWTNQCHTFFCPDPLIERLNANLNEQCLYDELIPFNQRLQIESKGFVDFFAKSKIDISDGIQNGCFNLDTAAHLATVKYDEGCKLLKGDAKTIADIKRRSLLVTIGQMKTEFQKLQTRVQCCVAGTLIALKKLPPKLNPIIRPIMDGIKKEENLTLQKRVATSLAKLLSLCATRTPCPNGKIVKNLCSFVCCDQNKTPKIEITNNVDQEKQKSAEADNNDELPMCSKMFGILTLRQMQKDAAKAVTQKKGKPGRANSGHSAASLNIPPMGIQINSNDVPNEQDEEAAKLIALQTRGGELALSETAKCFESKLQEHLPSLWETCFESVKSSVTRHPLDPTKLPEDSQHAQNLINSLQVLEVIATSLHPSIQEKLPDLLAPLMRILQYPFTALRHIVARVLGVLSKIITRQTMQFFIEKILPLVDNSENLVCRQGAVEAISHIIDNLGIDILPYIVLLIVPLLGRMSDQEENVRLAATNCFATLIRYMPLEAGIPDPPGMSEAMIEQKQKERKFLEQLLNNKKLDSYDIPVPIKAELRKYQQDGVNWLAFLNKYKLHGILCDDMGLGKTLQSICIIAGDHLNRTNAYKLTGSEETKPLPSLVVCPPTLTGHWCYEVEKFCDIEHLNPLHYYGAPSDRQRLQRKLKEKNHNLVVASYDIVRNDCNFFLNIHWNYCVLDEGHIVKNSKTKLAKVIRQLKANHRLILSGTPIQNNVLELWSLFDFLMPGFLGTEKQFTAKYGKPILQSRDAKSSSKEQEAGVLAMEALHRQVLPFILRRLKEDVLQDLPPKIIQDYYCELSPLQVQLYEDFAKSRAKKNLDVTVGKAMKADFEINEKKQGSTHIFQALQYLRKVCNHPALVLTPSHPEFERIDEQLKSSKSSLHDIQNSSKLVALKQLLLDCGIGVTSDDENSSNIITDPVVSQHRALIFFQLNSMIDIVEKDLLKAHMPSVMYRRLDGSTPAGSRQEIVHRFNNDPSIDCLLLTTHVGGLGLNLTGADTVIFVEHDWNPSRDLQAMDRAHRIGQKKVVNVYRLISRGTLEEKIMGLQKFKLSIANTVITQDNSSLQSMDTSQLLDLFSVENEKYSKAKGIDESNDKKASVKAILEDLGELWDETQYQTEYNLDSFIQSLNNK